MKNVLEDNETINFKLNEALKLVSMLQEMSKEETKEELGQEHLSKHYNNLQAVNLLMSNLNGLRHSAMNSKNKGKEVDFKEHLDSKVKSFKTKTFNEMYAKQMIEQFDWVRTATQSNVEDKLLIENSNEQDLIGNYSARIAPHEPEQIGDSLDKLEELIKRIKSNRFNKFSRLFQTINHADHNLLVNICNRCKGEVKVV
jgi:hypothetical protein